MSEDNKWQLLDELGRKLSDIMESAGRIRSTNAILCNSISDQLYTCKFLVNSLKSEMIKEMRKPTT